MQYLVFMYLLLRPLFLVLAVTLFGLSAAIAELSGSVTGITDYIEYGYTKSDSDPAIQANLDYEHTSGLFLGFSIFSVDFGDHQFDSRSRAEITPYLG